MRDRKRVGGRQRCLTFLSCNSWLSKSFWRSINFNSETVEVLQTFFRLLGNQHLKSAISFTSAKCIGSPSSPTMIIFLYRVVGCDRQVCGSRGLLQSESGRWWHMCTCMSFIYRLLSSVLSFAFWLFFRRFPSIAAIDSFTARSHLEWSTAWSFQNAYFFMCHLNISFKT